jgi:hypothetical protein
VGTAGNCRNSHPTSISQEKGKEEPEGGRQDGRWKKRREEEKEEGRGEDKEQGKGEL